MMVRLTASALLTPLFDLNRRQVVRVAVLSLALIAAGVALKTAAAEEGLWHGAFQAKGGEATPFSFTISGDGSVAGKFDQPMGQLGAVDLVGRLSGKSITLQSRMPSAANDQLQQGMAAVLPDTDPADLVFNVDNAVGFHFSGVFDGKETISGSATFTVPGHQEECMMIAAGPPAFVEMYKALLKSQNKMPDCTPDVTTFTWSATGTMPEEAVAAGSSKGAGAASEGPADSDDAKAKTEETKDDKKKLKVTIVAIEGDTIEVLPGGDATQARPVKPGDTIEETDRLYTGIGSRVKLRFGDGAVTVVDELTDMGVAAYHPAGDAIQTRLWVKAGEVTAQVDKTEMIESDFQIRTPTASLGVRGTKFTVRYAEKPRPTTLVKVAEGKVWVRPENSALQGVLAEPGAEVRIGNDKVTSSGPVSPLEESKTAQSAPHDETPAAAAAAQAGPVEPDAAPSADAAIDSAYWDVVKDSDDPFLFEIYLERFPNGAFAGEAKARIAALKAQAPPQVAVPAEPSTGQDVAVVPAPKIETQVTSGPAPIVDCDWLAADPWDPQAAVAGVDDDKVDHARAIPACEDAVTRYPQEARLWVQLVRAYRLAGMLDRVLPRLEAASREGNLDAMALLGLFLADGPEDLRDEAEAMRLLRQAADAGNAYAMAQLGFAYAEGKHGLAKDQAEAMRLFRAAAETDDEMGAVGLADVYEYGRAGLPKDESEALSVYRKAAESGNRLAMNTLAFKYATGALGLPKDAAEAFRWYLKAAEHGVREAMLKVAWEYNDGRVVAQDYAESVRWYRKAADLGDESAMFSLGSAYQWGSGVPKDMTEAKRWYQKAAGRGYEIAKKKLDELAKAETAPPPEEAKAADEPKPEEKVAAVAPQAAPFELKVVAGEEDPGLVHGVAFSPDGTLLASGSDDHKIRLWDAATGKIVKTLEGHADEVRGVVFSPDGALLASASNDHTVVLWDVKTGTMKQKLDVGGDEPLYAVTFSPDGKNVASHNDDVIKLWDVKTGKLLRNFQERGGYAIRSLHFSPDGKRIAAMCDGVTQWSVADGNKLQTFASDRNVDALAFSPDWKRAATATKNMVALWKVTKYGGEPLKKSFEHMITDDTTSDWVGALAFAPDGDLLVSASDNKIQLWDVSRGGLRATIDVPRYSAPVTSIAVSPDGSTLAIGGGQVKFLPLNQAMAASAGPE